MTDRRQLTKIARRTWIGDSFLLGIPQTTGFFYLEADRPALIETSAAAVSDHVISTLKSAGVDTLAYIVLTHIHLDHAGGAGQLADAYPEALVVVHQQGARHLVDPSRLEASAARVFGTERMLRHWGHLLPIAPDKLLAVDDGDVIDLGDRQLDIIYAPGHAKHQVAIFDSDTEGVFLGDSAGIYVSEFEYQTPSAPPPDLDPDLAIQTLKKIGERSPALVFFTHFGIGYQPSELLTIAAEQYRIWGNIAKRAIDRGGDLQAIAADLEKYADPKRQSLPVDLQEQLAHFTPYETAAAGYKHYFDHLDDT